MAELQIADVRAQVALSIYTDFENFSRFKPAALHERSLATMLDQLLAWSGVLKSLRASPARAADAPKQETAGVT